MSAFFCAVICNKFFKSVQIVIDHQSVGEIDRLENLLALIKIGDCVHKMSVAVHYDGVVDFFAYLEHAAAVLKNIQPISCFKRAVVYLQQNVKFLGCAADTLIIQRSAVVIGVTDYVDVGIFYCADDGGGVLLDVAVAVTESVHACDAYIKAVDEFLLKT